jgi:hypothetical protein
MAMKTRAPGEPAIFESPAAIAPATPPAIMPKVVSRAFVFTSVICSGSTRGVSAAFSTPKAFDNTRLPSAQG